MSTWTFGFENIRKNTHTLVGRVCAFSSNSSRSGGRVVVNAIAVEEVYREVFTHQLTAPVASDVRRGPRTWILSSEEGGAAWIDGLNPLKLVWWNIVLSRYGLYHGVVFPSEICGCDNGCVNATLPLFLDKGAYFGSKRVVDDGGCKDVTLSGVNWIT